MYEWGNATSSIQMEETIQHVHDCEHEQTVYAAFLENKLVITVRKYTKEAFINNGEIDPYFMSIGYLAAKKRGVVFLLTKLGYAVVKHYEYSSKSRLYRLFWQSEPIDSAENLFNQFEYDVFYSPYLKDLDFDSRSSGEFVSRHLIGAPEEPEENCKIDIARYASEVAQFERLRDVLSYDEKLAQQEGRRRDPIEFVLMFLHKWDIYIQSKVFTRHQTEIQRLRAQKRHVNEKIFSLIEDPITDEDRYMHAESELKKIQERLLSGKIDYKSKIDIKSKLARIKTILVKKEDIEDKIEEVIAVACTRKVDLGFREFDGIGHE
jgi:hypothetical protein